MATMGGAAVIFLIALLLLTAGHLSLLWVILLILSPFVFILGVPFATGSGPEYLPTDPKLAQQAREARDWIHVRHPRTGRQENHGMVCDRKWR